MLKSKQTCLAKMISLAQMSEEGIDDVVSNSVLSSCGIADPLHIGPSQLSSEISFRHIHDRITILEQEVVKDNTTGDDSLDVFNFLAAQLVQYGWKATFQHAKCLLNSYTCLLQSTIICFCLHNFPGVSQLFKSSTSDHCEQST